MWLFFREQGIIVWIIAILFGLITAIIVVLDTRSPTKTAAYLLLILLLPFGGPLLYFLVGINYRKRKIYTKKLISNEALFQQVKNRIMDETAELKQACASFLDPYSELIDLHLGESLAPLSTNKVTLLTNGEEKFPVLYEALEKAVKFIHMEYYIFEDDEIGNEVKNILIRKAQQGVSVRIIFDDYGSHGLWKKIVDELRSHNVQIYPFFRVRFPLFANRLNFRDHRKVVIIDGTTGFIGGMNISQRYVNNANSKLYWRDTHTKIEGNAVLTLQYHFLSNWNFCSEENLGFEPMYFPEVNSRPKGSDLIQIITSGPDYPRASIMLSYFTAIMMARKSVYITSPYFIPNESIVNAIKKAALSGKDVRILLPGLSDTPLVNAAARFYILDLLYCGVKIYFYQKGFIHAKTMVVDDGLSIVGTANMDLRSFDLNFEINAVIYSKQVTQQLTQTFMEDLENSEIIKLEEWLKRGKVRLVLDGMARILAPLL